MTHLTAQTAREYLYMHPYFDGLPSVSQTVPSFPLSKLYPEAAKNNIKGRTSLKFTKC